MIRVNVFPIPYSNRTSEDNAPWMPCARRRRTQENHLTSYESIRRRWWIWLPDCSWCSWKCDVHCMAGWNNDRALLSLTRCYYVGTKCFLPIDFHQMILVKDQVAAGFNAQFLRQRNAHYSVNKNTFRHTSINARHLIEAVQLPLDPWQVSFDGIRLAENYLVGSTQRWKNYRCLDWHFYH